MKITIRERWSPRLMDRLLSESTIQPTFPKDLKATPITFLGFFFFSTHARHPSKAKPLITTFFSIQAHNFKYRSRMDNSPMDTDTTPMETSNTQNATIEPSSSAITSQTPTCGSKRQRDDDDEVPNAPSKRPRMDNSCHILNMPLNLFRDVIDLLAQDVRQAWQLRGVSRAFANEIRFNILAKHNLAEIDMVNIYGLEYVLDFGPEARYVFLVNRVTNPCGARPNLLPVIDDMAGFLVENGTSTEKKKDDYISVLCQHMASLHPTDTLVFCMCPRYCTESVRSGNVLKYLKAWWKEKRGGDKCFPPRTFPDATLNGHTIMKMAAAAVANDVQLFRGLLEELEETTELGLCPYFGFPLNIACEHGHDGIINAIAGFKRVRRVRGPTIVIEAHSWVSAVMVAIKKHQHSALHAMVHLVLTPDSVMAWVNLGAHFARLTMLAQEADDIVALDILLDLVFEPEFAIPQRSMRRILQVGDTMIKKRKSEMVKKKVMKVADMYSVPLDAMEEVDEADMWG